MSIASRVVPGDLGHDEAVFAEQSIHERRLADVRLADHRDAQRCSSSARRVGQSRDDRVEQIARSLAVDRRDRKHFFDAERIELVEVRGARIVDLVGDDHPRLAANSRSSSAT